MHLLQSVSLYDPARHLSPTPHPPTRRRTLQKSLSKLCLSLLVEQSPLLGAGIAMATITETLNPLRFVTPFDLFSPLLRVAYHLGHLANRITNRHAPDHQQVIPNPVVEYADAKETRVVASWEHRRVGVPLQEGPRSRGTLSTSDHMAAE